MAVGTGLDRFGKEYPSRFYDVGIAEEHALTFSAGLASNGLKPYFAVYSSFLQRGYDNLIHDIALQNLPVTVLVDRAGISEGDGATHHGIFDVPFLCQIPNMTVYAPSDFSSLKEAMDLSLAENGPVAIRYANSSDLSELKTRFKRIAPFVYSDFTDGIDYLIITYGRIVTEAMLACDAMREAGFKCGIILIERLKPLSDISGILKEKMDGCVKTVFLEECIKNGGVGMILKEKIACDMTILAIDDVFDTPLASGNIFTDFGIGSFDVIRAFLDKKM
jgi:1-deoxy-D-xylulose-5-phosphate synthase